METVVAAHNKHDLTSSLIAKQLSRLADVVE